MAWWYAAIYVGALIIAYSYIPKTEIQPPAGLDEIKAPTAEAGREIPVLFGTRKLTGPNVVWFGDLRVSPVKKKGGK